MSKTLWNDISDRMNNHDYMAGITRTISRIKATGEIFTPTELVIEMLKLTPDDCVKPSKVVLDPACGDGQFLVGVKWLKVLKFEMDEESALSEIYGVDIMRDNVDICKKRLGGGNIIMGDTLNPALKLAKQTLTEHQKMIELFTNKIQLELF
jgi:type I restriction-modification system DNA methylase subunit